MRFQIMMKTPDGLNTALNESCGDDDEYYSEVQDAYQAAQKWFRWDEIVTLEIDTEKETCIVLEN